jgi:hypothetical protein
VRRDRIDLPRLCHALAETGRRMARVTYRAVHDQLIERFLRRATDRPAAPERIGALTCLRLNTPGGFDGANRAMVERCARDGGIAVVYGHPHSLHSGNSQDRRHFVALLELIVRLRSEGRLRVLLPGALA